MNNIDSILQRSLYQANKKMNTSLERLATGLRINNPGDDAAGLAISTRLNTNIRGLNQAKSNIQTGVNMLKTADDGLSSISTSLQKLKDLSVQAANGTYSASERRAFQAQADQLIAAIAQTQDTTKFNGINLLGKSEEAGNHISKEEAIAQGYTVIETADDFANLVLSEGSVSSGKKYMLMNDIDLSSLSSAYAGGTFDNILDGNGYTVKNFSSNKSLFGTIGTSGEIKNLNVENFNIDAGGATNVGSLISVNNGRVDNVHVKNSTIKGYRDVGGLVGSNSGSISKSSSEVTVGTSYGGGMSPSGFGGLVGSNSGNISESYSNSTVGDGASAASTIGGLVGSMSNGSISDSYAKGSVVCTGISGGFVGNITAGSISDSYASVSGSSSGFSGFAGSAYRPSTNNLFFDTNAAGTIGSGFGSWGSATGLSGADFANASNFSAWDSSKWDFSGSSPKLSWEAASSSGASSDPVNVSIQVGNSSDETSRISLETSVDLSGIKVDLSSANSSRASIDNIEKALQKVTDKRAYYGISTNILEDAIDAGDIKVENLTDAKSTIMSANIAFETANMTKNQLLVDTTNSLMIQNSNNKYQLMAILLGIA